MATPNDLLNFGTAYGNLLGVTPEADLMSGFTPEQQTLLKDIQQRQQPVNPLSSIFDQKDANLQAQQNLLKQYQNLSQKDVVSSFVNPNLLDEQGNRRQKGFLDALKDPTEAQRNAFIAFGLGLASSTGDISQRLGTALGQGVGALQKTREQDRARELQALQFEGQQLGLERQNIDAQLEQAKFLAKEERLRQSSLPEITRLQNQFDLETDPTRKEQIRRRINKLSSLDQDPFRTGMAALVLSSVEDVQKQGKAAINVVSDLNTMSAALDKGISTGRGAETILQAKSFLSFLGLDTEKTSEEELFAAISNRLALQLRNPESGYGLPGSTSNQDLSFLRASVPSLRQTVEGNKLLIKVFKRQAENQVKAAEYGDKLIKDNGGVPPIDYTLKVTNYLRDLGLNTPILNDEERNLITNLNNQFELGDEASFVPGVPEGVVDPLTVPINLSGSM